ncbi:hypothetical protein K8B83_20075 [Shewanella inventionis]|uniref:Uncharacterized protein n=1 Tax=Shewanella inventionis TaxID=1738770 RepID=A0ABQ1J2M9_9GAMM|nr:hypothetical protein [Shewanella inventionis]MCL1158959.1 hypothetical protein [Shewanella inventionis]UAL43068.1 hypothetical protein K8B83_20075 [Shewanella inventionis]GGB57236.1 hypothetical protein GCM10011607_17270 [Shewanella inventionis]
MLFVQEMGGFVFLGFARFKKWVALFFVQEMGGFVFLVFVQEMGGLVFRFLFKKWVA